MEAEDGARLDGLRYLRVPVCASACSACLRSIMSAALNASMIQHSACACADSVWLSGCSGLVVCCIAMVGAWGHGLRLLACFSAA